MDFWNKSNHTHFLGWANHCHIKMHCLQLTSDFNQHSCSSSSGTVCTLCMSCNLCAALSKVSFSRWKLFLWGSYVSFTNCLFLSNFWGLFFLSEINMFVTSMEVWCWWYICSAENSSGLKPIDCPLKSPLCLS